VKIKAHAIYQAETLADTDPISTRPIALALVVVPDTRRRVSRQPATGRAPGWACIVEKTAVNPTGC